MQLEAEPDVVWVSALTGVPESKAHRFVKEGQNERTLFEHLRRMHRLGGRPSYVEIDAPVELYALARLLRPDHVVEVGVSSGVSSAYLLQALARNHRGTLHSVDRPKLESAPPAPGVRREASWAIPVGRTSGWAVPAGLRTRWDLRLGDKRTVLPELASELNRVDLFLYDVPHSDPGAFQEFLSLDVRFHSGSVALVDHGGTQEICPSLRRWARRRNAPALRRRTLGLAGFGSR